MNDLLEAGDLEPGDENIIITEDGERDIEAGPPVVPSPSLTDGGLLDFFQEVQHIKDDLNKLQSLLGLLQMENEQSKRVTDTASMKAHKEKLESRVDEIVTITGIIKRQIEKLDQDNLSNRKKPGCKAGTGVDRSRMGMTVNLKINLKGLISRFQLLEQQFDNEYKESVKRKLFAVTGEKPDDKLVETLIQTGESDKIFRKAIEAQGRGQIMDTLAEIQERHEEVKDLEQKLLELHKIFLDMAVLVESQGEMLNNIEDQVTKATEHVESGGTLLQKAKRLQKNKRYWVIIAIIILLLVVCVIVIPILKPWKSGQA